MKIKFELKWQDMWVGAYWKKKNIVIGKIPLKVKIKEEFHIWICVVPCLPIHVWWRIEC